MLNFGILLKSYDKDFDLAERLIESFNRFNPERLQMFIVVPESDVEQFNIFASDTITVLSESLLGRYLVDHEVAGIRPGYINQEIVKLSFWELNLTANYFCVDSDAVFIRVLSVDDFMFDESTPYTVLVEDNELKSEPRYYEQHWKGREPQLRKIQELIGLKVRQILTCHGHQVFSTAVLESLKSDFMSGRGWSYRDLLEASPYEFSWYNMWLQKSNIIPIYMREPLVKVMHNHDQLVEMAFRGQSLQDLSRGYLGLVINSNFSRGLGEIRAEEPRSVTIARYAGISLLTRALLRRIAMLPATLRSKRAPS
jgi:hypothetical protein